MQVKIYKCHPDAVVPQIQEPDAAGFDLHAIEGFSLYPWQRIVVGTGLVVQPPDGYHTEVLLRSGMAYKHNIMLINGVGLIDRSYAGANDELKVMLYRAPLANVGPELLDIRSGEPVQFKKGDRIAQLVFRKTERFELVEVDTAPGDNRGGFGSTGQ